MVQAKDFKQDPTTEFAKIDDLTKDQARQEIDALREAIEYHDRKYYTENDPVISDAVYDQLFDRLVNLEEAYPDFQSKNSPTERVGAEPLDELQRIDHAAPMLSLNAAFEEGKLDEFHDFVLKEADIKSVEYVVEPKYDGVSVEVVYENGEFQHGATRGDGETGEEISANLKTIGAIPLKLKDRDSLPDYLAVRGEVFISRDGFHQMNKQRIERDEEPYANARNAASGILRRLESKTVARYPLDIFFYDILKIEGTQFETHQEELRQFSKWGLKIDPHYEQCSTKKDVVAYHQKLTEEREELKYEIDGIVIKLDRKEYWDKLGTRHRSPRWALAWKFEPREEVTTLEEIVIQVGRTGKLTPVALLQPVDVGGVTVSRATLHNEHEARKKDVRPGDEVRIARAGDVIPEVVERVKQPGKKRAPKFQMPETCPVCGTEIVTEGAYHFCPAGLSCAPQLIGRIQHFASREALDIEGLGEETSRDLVKHGYVENLADLYCLDVKDIKSLEGFAEKSAQKLHSAIQETNNPSLDRFLYALGIRHVGERVARDLAVEFETLDAIRNAQVNDLTDLPEIGREIAESVVSFFGEKSNQKVLKRMKELGVSVQRMSPDSGAQSLKDRTFVFTGSLENYSRSEAKRAVEKLGGRATSSVSSETDYLVVGDDPGSKYDEAQEEDSIQVLDEQGFKDLLNQSSSS